MSETIHSKSTNTAPNAQSGEMPDEHYASLKDVERRYWWHLSRLDRAERMLRSFVDPRGLRALDIGCGTGGFIAEMHARCGFRQAVGCDISLKGISRCTDGDVAYSVIEPGDFSLAADADIVFLMDVLEHVEDDAAMLGEIFSRIPDGGRILISVPAHRGFHSLWDESLGHYRRYSKGDLRALVERAGGVVLGMEYAFLVAGIAILLRKWGFFKKSQESCEFPPVPALLNKFLRSINALEGALSGFVSPPFGGSLFAFVKKAGPAERSKKG